MYLLILYRCIASRNRFVNRLYRCIASRNRFVNRLYRCIASRNRFVNRLYRCIASKNRFLNWLYRFIARKLDQLYRFIAGKIILSRNLCRFITGIHKFRPILSLHRCRKIFVWFFLSLHRWQKFWRIKLYRFIRFFSQKLCICIALNDTFLSIAAHHWI